MYLLGHKQFLFIICLSTQFSYDDLSQLIQTIDALNGVAVQEFDADGNRSALVDANNNRQEFTYNLTGRLTGISSATGSLQYTYNQIGLIESIINGRGQTKSIQYDDAGRIISQTDPCGTINYTYDNNGNLLTVTDESGVITRQYDELNRVASYTDARGNTIGYSYDEIGNLTCLTYPDGKHVYYTYDAASRLTQVEDWANRITTYAYDANNRLIETQRPDGSLETRIYDDAGKLIQQIDKDQNGNVLTQFDFTYNAAGNITQESSNLPDSPLPEENTTMTYTSDNRLATYNGATVVYDADGNMTVGPLNGQIGNYTFDSRNRLTAVGNTSYTYDAENNRISITESGMQYDVIINPTASLSQVLLRTGPDNSQTFYVYGLGLIGEESGTDYKVYHYDLRGSTVMLTDGNGATTDSYQYGPYGELLNHLGTSNTTFLYNGRDGVMTDYNGLYYMRARYYCPEIKRFILRDSLEGSITDPQTINRYSFVKGNPPLYIDPLGLKYWDINLGAGFIVGGTAGLLYDPEQDKLYYYAGPAITTPTFGVTVTQSPNDVSLGWNWGVQLSPGVGSIQLGSELNKNLPGSFGELGAGLGAPAINASAYKVTLLSDKEYNKFREKLKSKLGYDLLGQLRRKARCK